MNRELRYVIRVMFSRFFIFCGCVFVLSGCVYTDEPMPEIAYDHIGSSDEFGEVGFSKPSGTTTDVPWGWVPSSQLERKWTAIVIHHSGTKTGNAAIFDKWHRESNYWEGVGYDFVIGNGTDSGDGEVEVTLRWRNQMTGAHCGGTAGNWANKYGVGICLVGNFNQTVPTARQLDSLVKLVRFLQGRYGIPNGRIYGHNSTPGARVTDCPGRNFPIGRLKSMLDF